MGVVVVLRFLRDNDAKSTASAIHKIRTIAPRTPPIMATTVLEFLGGFEVEGFGREGEEEEEEEGEGLEIADASAALEVVGDFELEGLGREEEEDEEEEEEKEEEELGTADDASAVLEDGLVSEFVGFGSSDVLLDVDAAKMG